MEENKEVTPVKSGRIRVTNMRFAPKFVYDVEGKVVVIPANGSATFFAVERQERDLRKVKYLKVESVAEDDDGVPAREGTQLQDPEPEEPVALTPQALLDRADEMEYPEFLRQSKLTLGDDFPTGRAGGQPRKAELVRVLRGLVS